MRNSEHTSYPKVSNFEIMLASSSKIDITHMITHFFCYIHDVLLFWANHFFSVI